MSRIKRKDTKPEIIVRKFLHKCGFRYKLHVKDMPGKPDIVLPKFRTIIQVHGCFWHGHKNCQFFVVPQTNTEWWIEKINRNITNDKKTYKTLIALGWHIITIWECEIKPGKIEKTLAGLPSKILSCK